MSRWFLVRRALAYRKTIRQLKRDKSQLQGAIERLERQLRIERLEVKRLKTLLILNQSK